MFCSHCGAENPDNGVFCMKCGEPLRGGQSQDSLSSSDTEQGSVNQSSEQPQGTNPTGQAAVQPQAVNSAGKPASSVNMKLLAAILGGAVAVIILLVVIVSAVGKARRTINLDDYVTVETKGYDGFGTAIAFVDWEAIEEDYGSRISFKRNVSKELGIFNSVVGPVDALPYFVNLTLDEKSGLSNGDTINYTWDVDDSYAEGIKCTLKYKDGSYEVNELEKVGKFDAFEDLEVEFNGIAPQGTVNLNYTGSDIDYYDFQCDKTSGLSNGDTVTVSLPESRVERYAERLGMVPLELEKQYTVEGLAAYLSKLDELGDEGLNEMKSQAEDVYKAHVARDWNSETSQLDSMDYLGEYLLTPKDGNGGNILYLVYKVTAHNSYTNDKDESYDALNSTYWYIKFDNVMLDADGNLDVDLSRYSTPYDTVTIDSEVRSGWNTVKWWYYGYDSVDSLYSSAVTKNVDRYNHEDNVHDK